MTTTTRKDEGAFGSILALLVVGGFLVLAAGLLDAGPVETIVVDPVDEVVEDDSLLAPDRVLATR